jgi:hypothetical protein
MKGMVGMLGNVGYIATVSTVPLIFQFLQHELSRSRLRDLIRSMRPENMKARLQTVL